MGSGSSKSTSSSSTTSAVGGREAEWQREGAEGQESAAVVELLVLPQHRGTVRGRLLPPPPLAVEVSVLPCATFFLSWW
jgi:hypothetical protein